MAGQAAARLGADIGGTFTDVVLEAGGVAASAKVLTTHGAPEEAVIEGLGRVCREAGVAPSALAQVIHGTTLATNALIERRGARTALVTTEGFRDVIEMRTESRFEQYDLNLRLPEPLIPRQRRLTVTERIDARGRVLIPLGDLDGLLEALERGRYESVAVGLLHAYANPAHERAVRDAIRARLPGVSVSLSCEVSPQMREYERVSTVCADAYVKPLIGGYLRRLEGRLREAGADCPVFLMHSGGGIMALDTAAELPVRLVESGPAGGAIFAAHLAARHGLDRALSFDMGGTTAKLCLIRDAAPKRARVFEVARSTRFKKGSGMPVSIPVIDMVEIGAGGGSLASVDAMGRVAVGPRSAGSEPGPACYGRGGEHPAVTDADLTLGRLDPDRFAGGSIALSAQAAQAALMRDVGEPLGLDAPTAALAVSEMVDEAMASAARVHAVEQGEDPSAYAMIAFGGAAPLHAARLCETLGIDRFLVPPGAGVGSALGFLRAPAAFEATRSHVMRLSAWDATQAREVIDALTEEARAFVARCGGDGRSGPSAEGDPSAGGEAGACGGLEGGDSDGGGPCGSVREAPAGTTSDAGGAALAAALDAPAAARAVGTDGAPAPDDADASMSPGMPIAGSVAAAPDAEVAGHDPSGGDASAAAGPADAGPPAAPDAPPLERTVVLHMRYVGQGWEIPVPLDEALAAAPEASAVLAAFEAAYAALFERTVAGADVEVTSFAVQVATPLPEARPVPPPPEGRPAEPRARRPLLDPASGRRVEAALVARAALGDGAWVAGPALIEEAETTIVVPPGWRATGRADGTVEAARDRGEEAP